MSASNAWKEYKAHRGLSLSSKVLVLILGALMVTNGVIAAYDMFVDYTGPEQRLDFSAHTLLLVVGIAVMLSFHRSAPTVVLIAGVGLAVTGMTDTLLGIDGASKSIVLAMFGVDLVMALCSVSYYLSNRHNAWRLIVTSLIHVVLVAVLLSIGWWLYQGSVWDLIIMSKEDVMFAVVFAMFIVFLLQPGVREDSIAALMRKGVMSMEAVAVSRPRIYIRESALRTLIGEDRSEWQDLPEGPVRSEARSKIMDGKMSYECISRIWRDEDFVRVTFDRDLPVASYGSGFEIHSVAYADEEMGRFVHLFGREGYFIKLRVMGDEEDATKFSESLLDDHEYKEYHTSQESSGSSN